MTEKDIVLIRGDTKSFILKIKDTEGQPRDITGATVTFVIARGREVYLSKAVTEHTLPLGGETAIQIWPADWPSTRLYESGYIYEIEIKFSETEVYTLIRGVVSIIDDINK